MSLATIILALIGFDIILGLQHYYDLLQVFYHVINLNEWFLHTYHDAQLNIWYKFSVKF